MQEQRRSPRQEPARPARHGVVPGHVGRAREPFAIAHNGTTVSFNTGDIVRADDALFDLIQEHSLPVAWR